MPRQKRTEWTEIHTLTMTMCPRCLPRQEFHVGPTDGERLWCKCGALGIVKVRSTTEGTNSYAVLWMIEEGEE